MDKSAGHSQEIWYIAQFLSAGVPAMSLPHWFQRALDAPSQTGDTEVEGVNIHFETWGDPDKPGIVLVHGSNAHLEWWRFVAPYLADQFRVVALDSSGNGDSGWRTGYSGRILGEEVWAVCQAAQLGPRPFVVGHSFGGFVALETGHLHGANLGGILFLDYTTAPPEQYLEWGMRSQREDVKAGRKLRVYPSREAILQRFRLIPEQDNVHPAVLAHVASKGIRQVQGGWTWKFDPSLFDHLEMGMGQRDKFMALPCRTAVILGEHSKDEGALYGDYMASLTGGALPVFRIPGTHHHLMFDEPIAVVAAIKATLLNWLREGGDNGAEAH